MLPYIEFSEGKPRVSGLALFKKYKMVNITNMQEARIINMLREESGRGNLDYIIDSKLFTSSNGEVKRKIECEKAGNQYVFNITLNFTEDIVSNTLYKDLESKPKIIKEYENAIEAKIKKQCEDFIYKMQNEYKIDCLEIGKEACAKFGRGTGTDWDEAVSKAKINVNVKIKSFGRGRYVK